MVPGGRTLAGAGKDHRAHLWDVDPASWCGLAARDLTRSEWAGLRPGRPYRKVCHPA
jgi:hypothetical protein